jgi:hypothetical protein
MIDHFIKPDNARSSMKIKTEPPDQLSHQSQAIVHTPNLFARTKLHSPSDEVYDEDLTYDNNNIQSKTR